MTDTITQNLTHARCRAAIRRSTMGVSMPVELINQLSAKAAAEDTNVSKLVRAAVIQQYGLKYPASTE
jgi:hypothetical protein